MIMKVNDKELADLSFGAVVFEGRLHHKKVTGNFSQAGFKERWFKLRANILFYFNLSETGKIYDKKPAGAMILENATIQYEMNGETPFSFSVLFHDDIEKKHLFSGRTEEYINQWVSVLKKASYEYWRSQLLLLQTKLRSITGKDPLLMFPRNEGSKILPVEETNSRSSHRNSSKRGPSTQSSSFRSYVPNVPVDNTSQPKIPVESFFNIKENHFSNGLDLIGTDLKNTVINPIPPPVRPTRSPRVNRPNGANLIDL